MIFFQANKGVKAINKVLFRQIVKNVKENNRSDVSPIYDFLLYLKAKNDLYMINSSEDITGEKLFDRFSVWRLTSTVLSYTDFKEEVEILEKQYLDSIPRYSHENEILENFDDFYETAMKKPFTFFFMPGYFMQIPGQNPYFSELFGDYVLFEVKEDTQQIRFHEWEKIYYLEWQRQKDILDCLDIVRNQKIQGVNMITDDNTFFTYKFRRYAAHKFEGDLEPNPIITVLVDPSNREIVDGVAKPTTQFRENNDDIYFRNGYADGFRIEFLLLKGTNTEKVRRIIESEKHKERLLGHKLLYSHHYIYE